MFITQRYTRSHKNSLITFTSSSFFFTLYHILLYVYTNMSFANCPDLGTEEAVFGRQHIEAVTSNDHITRCWFVGSHFWGNYRLEAVSSRSEILYQLSFEHRGRTYIDVGPRKSSSSSSPPDNSG